MVKSAGAKWRPWCVSDTRHFKKDLFSFLAMRMLALGAGWCSSWLCKWSFNSKQEQGRIKSGQLGEHKWLQGFRKYLVCSTCWFWRKICCFTLLLNKWSTASTSSRSTLVEGSSPSAVIAVLVREEEVFDSSQHWILPLISCFWCSNSIFSEAALNIAGLSRRETGVCPLIIWEQAMFDWLYLNSCSFGFLSTSRWGWSWDPALIWRNSSPSFGCRQTWDTELVLERQLWLRWQIGVRGKPRGAPFVAVSPAVPSGRVTVWRRAAHGTAWLSGSTCGAAPASPANPSGCCVQDRGAGQGSGRCLKVP